MNIQTIKNIYSRELLVKTLACFVVVLVVIQVYAAFSTVADATRLTELNSEIVDHEYAVTKLEFASINTKNSLTIDRAEDLGLQRVSDPVFVSRGIGVALR